MAPGDRGPAQAEVSCLSRRIREMSRAGLRGIAAAGAASVLLQGDAMAPTPGSLLRPFRSPTFRALMISDFVSDVGGFMQSVGAGWLMISLGAGPMLVALTQTASALPYFLLALVAGAVADIVDRRKLLVAALLWMIAVAGALAAFTLAGRISPWLLLAFTFALAAGAAVAAPAWRAIFPEVVGREDLEAASMLGGIGFNLARAVGPGLAGLLIAARGAGIAFLLNALSFVGVVVVVLRWKRPLRVSRVPSEKVGGATVAALRYVRYSRDVKSLLVRGGGMMLFGSGLLALMPTLAREAGGGAASYGVLLGCFGAGAVLGAVLLQPMRARWTTDQLVTGGSAVVGLAVLATALARPLALLAPLMLASGAGWIAVTSILAALAQSLAPDWVRARVTAVWILVTQGSTAVGSALWGAAAQHAGMRLALLAAGAGALATVLLRFRFRLPDAAGDASPWRNDWPAPALPAGHESDIDGGPVLVTVDYLVEPENEAEFVEAIHDAMSIRRRDGADRWGVFYDVETPGRYVEAFVVTSWAEHVRQHDRTTMADRPLVARLDALTHRRGEPVVRHFLYARERR